jgi:hypothetical protein
VRAKVEGGGDGTEGSKSAPSPTQDPVSDLWLPYYAAAQREADVRAAVRARHEQSAYVLTRLICVVAVVVAVALFAFLR